MKILIDIGHPAHVHLFKHFAWLMQEKGHYLYFTCRQKEFEIELLKAYKFSYKSFGRPFKTIKGKIFGLLLFDIKIIITALKFKPHLFLSCGSMYAAHAAFFLKKPHISLEDTFNNEQVILYKYFTNVILTGNYQHPKIGKRNIKYNGYHELAYLHPKYFSPNPDIYNYLNVKQNEPFTLVRFVAWNATHDFKHKGISYRNKIKLISEIAKINKVYISSEETLPSTLVKYKLNIPPERIHDVIFYANLVIGESATMASEAAVLGTPAIYIDNTGRLYTKEQEEKYGLVFNYSESEDDQLKSIKKGIELLNSSSTKKEWEKKHNKLLSDKIDVTAFLVWFIENFPKSFVIMKRNPEYQDKFKK